MRSFSKPQISAADFVLETGCKIAAPSVPSGLSMSSALPGSSMPAGLSELPASQTSSGSVLHFMHKEDEIFSASLLPGYNISAYMTAFIAASAAALELGVEREAVVAVLEGFRGLSGRMQEREMNGIALIDNSNSGMDILSAEKALEYALLKKKDEKKEGIILVLGEEASQVCEGLPPESVQVFRGKIRYKMQADCPGRRKDEGSNCQKYLLCR